MHKCKNYGEEHRETDPGGECICVNSEMGTQTGVENKTMIG